MNQADRQVLRFVMLGLLSVPGCAKQAQPPRSEGDTVTSGGEKTIHGFDGSRNKTFSIAIFNLKNFGMGRAAKPEVMNTYVDAIRRYDLVALQEIENKNGEIEEVLINAVNATRGPNMGSC